MELKKKVPEVRFKGFSGEWEELKLNQVSEIIGGGTPSTIIPEFWDGDIDWYSPTEIGDKVYAEGSVKKITALGLENSSAKILPANKTVLFTSRAGIGDMAILRKDGATNQGFQSFVIKEDNDPYFVYSKGHLIKDYALKHASGSTFLEVSGKQLGNMNFYIPVALEQSRIGTWFQHLDQLITLHQKKYNKLTNIKKAMLEKMFPKNGADVPELRFEGFEGKWEEKRLGEIAEFCRGKGMNKEAVVDNGSYKCVLYGHLYTTYGMVINDVIYSTNKFDNDMYLSRIGDVLIPCSDTTPTGLARATSIELDGVILGGDINILRPNKQIDGSFLSYNINSNRYKLLPLIKGTTVRHIDNSELKTVELYIAKDNREQKQIVQFFQKLDQLITLQQTQIDKLQNIKKACLEKMFV